MRGDLGAEPPGSRRSVAPGDEVAAIGIGDGAGALPRGRVYLRG